MSHEKIARIVMGVIRRTGDGKIDWETTERTGVFQASFPNYSIRLSTIEGDLGVDYWFAIINNEGATIERVSDVDLSSNIEAAFEEMGNLYSAARRIALGVEKALDELLEIIDRDELI
ncbi:hypothetical protein CS078_10325 [Pseudomonas prosekii]|uniref:Uncharacterized protein n=1 Tax=Pseudomonas prosekii TaxID=1148509 RepID=A0A3L8CRX2_9PSED|nr:hypothetical protein [Pseudomonas prosekii]RLU07405.1 hypothetical protein CS076_18310 [Pseudomonas prosekii]RLU10504.1 hypothetical protein CS078_10325 [Pseudomonas prosekii]